jgi:hypothetical protein
MELLRGKEESDKSTAEEHHHPICQKVSVEINIFNI